MVGGNLWGDSRTGGEEGKAFSSAFCLGLGVAFACNDRRAIVGGWSPRHPYGPINTPAMGGVFL